LLIFGGQVLRGFSFALTVGILIGRIVHCGGGTHAVAYQDWRKSQGRWQICQRRRLA